MIRVVLDTNVLFSAILKSTGNEATVFSLIFADRILPCVSPAVLAEYHEVLNRPALRPHTARLKQILSLIAKVAVVVSPQVSLTVATDPDDNRFLECAEAAGAEYLITGNKRHFPTLWKETRIVNAREFLVEWLDR